MKCYTTYFDGLNAFLAEHPEIVPISICGKAPDWWHGHQYRKLAPRLWFFLKWKDTHDNDFYVRNFNKEVLGRFEQAEVWEDLLEISGGFPFVLLCYEKPGDFCHRHLVSEWLRKAGYDISEFKQGEQQ